MPSNLDVFAEMLRLQEVLQERINGYKINEQTIETRLANISLNVLACTDELHEVLGETGWKPWATSRHINVPNAQREMVDVFCFFMNLMLHLGMTTDDLFQLYLTKNEVNHTRQDSGYDGVRGKCPQCHRDLSEIQLREVVADKGFMPRVDIHCECGYPLGSRPV